MAKGWLEDYANQLKIIVLRQALVIWVIQEQNQVLHGVWESECRWVEAQNRFPQDFNFSTLSPRQIQLLPSG